MSDYPYVAVEQCPECGLDCVAVLERVVDIGHPSRSRISGSIRTQMIILQICEHLIYDAGDDPGAEFDEADDLE